MVFEIGETPDLAAAVRVPAEQVSRDGLWRMVATVVATKLRPDTTYYVRAIATLFDARAATDVRPFRTKTSAAAPPSPPRPETVAGSQPAASDPASAFPAPPTFFAGRADVVFLGGTLSRLEQAIVDAGGSGAWGQDARGEFVLFIPGGGAANAPFVAAFPDGFTSAAALVIVRR